MSSLSRPFTDALVLGQICYQRCDTCGSAQRLARYACTACGGNTLSWHEASGRGTVFAVTEVKRAPTDAFKALTPYTLVLVDLDEGARLMGHASAGVGIGDRVQGSVFRIGDQPLIRFEPQRG